MKKKLPFATKILAIVLALISLNACSPKVIKISPIAEIYKEEGDRRIVKEEKEGIKIVTSYDGEFNNFIVFDTEIFNKTNDTLKIDPSAFSLVPFGNKKDTLVGQNGYSLFYYAANPEQQIKEAELAMERAKTRHTINTVFNVLLLAANLYSDVSSSWSSNYRSSASDFFFHQSNYQALAFKQQIDDASFYHRLDKLRYERGNWQAETFRKTFLMPSESLRGRIYLPKTLGASFLKMAYPVPSGDEISFWFDQKVVKAERLERY